jgi:hypothetical protein
MFFYAYYDLIDHALRSIAFKWLKWYPEHKRIKPFESFTSRRSTYYKNLVCKGGLVEWLRLQRVIKTWVTRNFISKGQFDLQWIVRKNTKSR